MSQLYVALDTETGGRDCKKTDVLTAYFGIFDQSFKLIDELDLKLKPDGGRLPICEAEALEVNKIDLQKHLADPATITYSEAKVRIVAFFKKHLKKTGRYSNLIPLGYNLPFDFGYIWEYLVDRATWDSIIHYRMADFLAVVNFFKDCGWFPRELGNLSSVIDFLGVPKRPAHNAKEDTLMCVDGYKAAVQLMVSRKNPGNAGQQDLISLLEAE